MLRRSRETGAVAYHRARIVSLSSGLSREPSDPPLVVSLTTTEDRLSRTADIAVATLLTQHRRPDRVVLWLSDTLAGRRLPRRFRWLIRAGLEVRYCPDLGPHTKLIHALREFPDSVLVTADDDIFYPETWLSGLYGSYRTAPDAVHCHRAHLMRTTADGKLASYYDWDLEAPGVTGPNHLLFPTGVGGVLYPPGCLSDEVFNIDAFRRLCPTNDDIWFKAMALLAGTTVRKVAPHSARLRVIRGSQESALMATNTERNDAQLQATFDAYDLYRLL